MQKHSTVPVTKTELNKGSDILNRMENHSLSDVGGTPGGLGHFLLGFVMACIGGYLITNQVKVVGSYWSFYGANTFGITLLPMLFGVAILFWNGRSTIGWLLTIAGALTGSNWSSSMDISRATSIWLNSRAVGRN
jgi:hypothetical protein